MKILYIEHTAKTFNENHSVQLHDISTYAPVAYGEDSRSLMIVAINVPTTK
jgi:hypothetical protein